MYKSGKILLVFCVAMFFFSACKKDYYQDTGKHKADFNGTVMDYLESKPEYFDSLVKVIKFSGLENTFRNETITFFAPADSSIRETIHMTNLFLTSQGLKQVIRLEQIKPSVWRKYLARYLFKGAKSLTDFPQMDPQNLAAFPGQIYASYDNELMNVGVIYNDAGGVKYAGYRQLNISYIPSATAPRDYRTWYPAIVASANIKPKNGYVHVLNYRFHSFGFRASDFYEDATFAGID